MSLDISKMSFVHKKVLSKAFIFPLEKFQKKKSFTCLLSLNVVKEICHLKSEAEMSRLFNKGLPSMTVPRDND